MNDGGMRTLADAAAKVTSGERVSTSGRQLLEWFGAMRRGTLVTEQIRAALYANGLRTQPDFETVADLDQRIALCAAEAADQPPWPAALVELAAFLKQGTRAPSVTVRDLLGWFGAERRGQVVVQRVREALDGLGLRTQPDFESAYIDAVLEIERAPAATDAGPDARHSTAPATGEPAAAEAPTSVDAQRVTASTTDDAVLRIGTMPSADLEAVQLRLHKVAPTEPLASAITTMLLRDHSQLPVMSDDRTVKGVITWKSIGQHLGLKDGWRDLQVGDFMVPHAEVRHDDSLLTAIPLIVANNYVLVRGSRNTITGIVTTMDLALQFREQTEPFLLLGEIESQIRRLISGKFTVEELAAASAGGDADRVISAVHEMTFGGYLRLLQRPEHWGRLNLPIDRRQFLECLDEVRVVRNGVMHFDPGAQRPEQLETLRRASRFLRELQVTGAL